MPNRNGLGPNEVGCGWGRRLCAGRPFGSGRGMGYGHGFGPGRGQGWVSIGYGRGGEESVAVDMRLALQRRADSLKAELARTESLLGVNALTNETE